jgi:ribosome-binding ATPase
LKLAIVGLPGSGKSSLFQAITGVEGSRGGPHSGENPKPAVCKVPDPRMEVLREMFKPKKFTLASLEFLDFAGVLGGDRAATGGGPLVAALRAADALVRVGRAFGEFEDDPLRDMDGLETEILLLDLDQVDRRIERLETSLKKGSKNKDAEEKELGAMQRAKSALGEGKPVSSVAFSESESKLLANFAFLSKKPSIDVINIAESRLKDEAALAKIRAKYPDSVVLCAPIEMEIAALEPADRQAFLDDLGIPEPAAARLIRASYRSLGLRSFFTVGEDEVKAWTIRGGDDAVTASGKIHTDLARGFIRAEVLHYDDLKAAGSMKEAKAKNKLRLEGRDYEVKDGDILNIRFSV